MTSYFLDTSAHLKRYLEETGSDVVDALFDEHASRHISSVGLLECLSGLQRLRAAAGLITGSRLGLLLASVASDIDSERVTVVTATAADIEGAAAILRQRYLTAVDALQIAIAKNCGPGVIFVSSDSKLNAVAAEEGLAVLDPSTQGRPRR